MAIKARNRQGVVAHVFSPNTREAKAEAGRFSEFQDSKGYTEKFCLEKYKRKEREKMRLGRWLNR